MPVERRGAGSWRRGVWNRWRDTVAVPGGAIRGVTSGDGRPGPAKGGTADLDEADAGDPREGGHRRDVVADQHRVDPRSLIATELVVLATSLPVEDYPADQVLAAYRLRWQIELAFKRLKSLLHIDRLPTHTAAASRSWLLAHLIVALLCDDISQEILENLPPQDLPTPTVVRRCGAFKDRAAGFDWLADRPASARPASGRAAGASRSRAFAAQAQTGSALPGPALI